MTHTAYDAAGFAKFDLAQGTIQSPEDQALTLIPLDLVASLAPTPGLRTTAANWGKLQAAPLVNNTGSLNLDDLALSLQTSVSLMGLGNIAIEIYGDALLFNIKSNVELSGTIKAIIEGFLAGYLNALKPEASFETASVSLNNNGYRIFAGNQTAVSSLKSWISDGLSLEDALGRLNRQGGAL